MEYNYACILALEEEILSEILIVYWPGLVTVYVEEGRQVSQDEYAP